MDLGEESPVRLGYGVDEPPRYTKIAGLEQGTLQTLNFGTSTIGQSWPLLPVVGLDMECEEAEPSRSDFPSCLARLRTAQRVPPDQMSNPLHPR